MSTPQYEIQNILKRAQEMDISQTFQPYSGVEIIVDDETTIAYPTDDETRHTGRVLTINNPWGTVEIIHPLEQYRLIISSNKVR